MPPAPEVPIVKPAVWKHPHAQVVGASIRQKALVNIAGRSGAGKTHLAYQLLHDPDYGPEEVLIFMREDGTSTYGEGANVVQLGTMQDAQAETTHLIEAAQRGVRLPKVLFVDSMSGLALGTQQYRREVPISEWSEKAGKEVVDKRATFGELGTLHNELMLDWRDKLPMDVVVLMTTYSPGPGIPPEVVVEGKMIPKFMTALSTVALYLVPEAKTYPRAVVEKELAAGTLYQPHRFVDDFTPGAETDVTIISRFFYTQDTGEVLAKGHRNLKLKEKAYLPEILRKIHGEPFKTEVKK